MCLCPTKIPAFRFSNSNLPIHSTKYKCFKLFGKIIKMDEKEFDKLNTERQSLIDKMFLEKLTEDEQSRLTELKQKTEEILEEKFPMDYSLDRQIIQKCRGIIEQLNEIQVLISNDPILGEYIENLEKQVNEYEAMIPK